MSAARQAAPVHCMNSRLPVSVIMMRRQLSDLSHGKPLQTAVTTRRRAGWFISRPVLMRWRNLRWYSGPTAGA